MPCNSGQGYDNYDHEARRKLKELEALLCALCSGLEKSGALDSIIEASDWQEAGVTKHKLADWWETHKAVDERRRAMEAVRQQEAEAKAKALEKLTPEERRLLNIK